MLANLSLTYALAALIGLYFLAAGAGLLVDRKGIPAMIDNFTESPALAYVTGVMTFVIGGTLTLVHNDWGTILAAFVSLVGWLALLEGLLLLAFRERFVAAFSGMARNETMIGGFGILTIVLGAAILFHVFAV